jgi:hypothetical protein
MGVMLNIPDELAAQLAAEASQLGISLPDYIVQRLGATPGAVANGAELVEYWKARGLIGTRPDIQDSSEHARQIREKVQHRERG